MINIHCCFNGTGSGSKMNNKSKEAEQHKDEKDILKKEIITLPHQEQTKTGLNIRLATHSLPGRNTTTTAAAAAAEKVVSMINIEQSLRRSNPGGALYRPLDDSPRLCLQIHDELLFEVKDDHRLPQIAKMIRFYMENAVELNVPLQVKMKMGTSWGDMEDYVID